MRHPWELTLREFIEQVRRDYGIEIDPLPAAVEGGRLMTKNHRVYLIPVLDLDEVMPIFLLRSFCRFYRVPPEDFGMSAEEED